MYCRVDRAEFDDFGAGRSDKAAIRRTAAGRRLRLDTEHVPDELDQNILGVIEGADLVIYDSTYTEREWTEKIGWGHSTREQGMRLCRAAGAKRLAIFHHDPDHDDAFMTALEAEATAAWPGNLVAREGMVLDIA